MRYMLAILLNGIAELEYDREKPLDPNQATYIDDMDTKMDRSGVVLGEIKIPNPTDDEKYQFVASNLYYSIKADNEGMAAAMVTYLAVRNPDLKQVKFSDKDEEVAIELVYDEKYTKQVAVKFN